MFLLSFASRDRPDPVPALVDALGPIPTVLPPERTSGPHVLALLARADAAREALLAAAELGSWRIGLGIGPVERPLPASVRELDGPVVVAAREAARAARVTSSIPLAVRAADPRHEATAADAEAVARLIGWMVTTRNRGQWRVVRALREDPEATQRELADRLGITQQTVSRAVKTSGWREEHAAHPLLERLLGMIDLTS